MLRRVMPLAGQGLAQWRQTSLAPLQHTTFRVIWLATLASSVGAVIQTVGASWLMTSIGGGAASVALVQTAAMAPFMLFSLGAGALADVADRRLVMIAAQAFGMLAAGFLAALAYMHQVTPLILLAFTFMIGAVSAFHMPAWQTSIGELVPREDLPAAVAINMLATNIARSIGPAIGGAILAIADVPAAFVLNALSFAGLIIVLLRWRPKRETPAVPPESLGSAMLAGVRYVGLSPNLLAILMRGALFGAGASALWSLLPLIARELLDGGPLTYGALLASFGVGSMASALVNAQALRRLGNERLVGLGFLAFAASSVTVGLSHWLLLSATATFVAGMCWIFTLTTLSTSVQLSVPRWVVGRALSMSQVASVGGIALGAAGWGAVAHGMGLSITLALAGAFLTIAYLVVQRVTLPALQGVDLSPWGGTGVFASRAPIDHQMGPVAIVVEYRVRVEDAAAFLEALHTLGRSRVRDGARRWRVHQDLDDPELWREQFESPTWVDHLRRAARITVSDKLMRDNVQAFHIGEAPPVARRLVERPPGSEPIA